MSAPTLPIGRWTPADNGIYIVEGWRIAEHLRTEYDADWNPIGMRSFGPSEEEDWHQFDDMLRSFDASMPEELRLGEFLDSVEVPASELKVGDEVWMFDSVYGKWEAFPVVGFRTARVQPHRGGGRCSKRQEEDHLPRSAIRSQVRSRRRLLVELQQLRP